jgi:hypothetical protein
MGINWMNEPAKERSKVEIVPIIKPIERILFLPILSEKSPPITLPETDPIVLADIIIPYWAKGILISSVTYIGRMVDVKPLFRSIPKKLIKQVNSTV